MIVLSGSSNPKLAASLAEKLNCRLGQIELSRFPNSEARVWVKDKLFDQTAVVVQSFSRPTDRHIIEFCLICDAVNRLGAKKIIGVVPWLGYSKQDKVFRQGEPLSIKVIAQLIQCSPFKKLITLDLHKRAIIGFFDKTVIELSAQPLFSDIFSKLIKNNEFMVVAADKGSSKASTIMAKNLKLPVLYINKERDSTSGKISMKAINGKLKGKKVIIVEDLISTGSTLIKAAELLRKKGAGKIFVAATHHLFVPGAQAGLEKSGIERIYITDTVLKPSSSSKILKQISVADLIAQAIKSKLVP